VSFVQFLDICARAVQQQDAGKSRYFVQLVMHGCGKVGTKGLAELLVSPAATAALASALSSAFKLCPATNAYAVDEPAARGAAAAGAEELEHATKAVMSMQSLCNALHFAVAHIADEVAAHHRSSSSVQQALTSALLLVVLVPRGLLRLHQAVGAAGSSDQQFLACVASTYSQAHVIQQLLESRVDLVAAG
jgi:hypothetical protein